MNFNFIDFHTHPFTAKEENICNHIDFCDMSPDKTAEVFKELGGSAICGSVIRRKNENEDMWECISACNQAAMKLKEKYGDFYIPGFHIHPAYIEESINEIRLMNSENIRLIGELVPYMHGWKSSVEEGIFSILDEAQKYKMVVNLHSGDADEMDELVKRNKDVTFVLAHPGEYGELIRHIERMKKNENCYLDLSGTGIFRYGATRHLIDEVGVDRLLFGSDYPTCNPGMFVGAILFDSLLSDIEKEKIFFDNAKRILGT